MYKKKGNGSIGSLEGRNLIIVDYEITNEPVLHKSVKRLPSRVRKQIEQLHEAISSKPAEAIPSLLKLIEKYPQVPVLDNYLTAAYRLTGQEEKADSLTLESYKRHPDYLFSKIDYAFYCLQQGDPYKIPEIFDHKLELRLLYPDRRKFHISEFMSFMGIMALYNNAIGERKTAIKYYEIIKQVDPSYDLVRVLKSVLYPPLLVRLLRKIVKIPAGGVKFK
ncbi:MAG: hypothetical protein AB1847_07845 [bacterium]